MAAVITAENGVEAWTRTARWLLRAGEKVSPRGMLTYEDRDVVLVIDQPHDVLLTGIGRQYNTALASLEALQLISGTTYPHLLTKVAPNTARFMDGGHFHGAYGPRTRSQLPVVVDRLKKDPDSRQAIVVLWDPVRDLFTADMSDYPCTVMFSFLIRGRKLELHTTMRSNDLWWGLTYDMFQFTQLQQCVADALSVDAGPYFHHAVSMHLYDRDMETINSTLVAAGTPDTRKFVYGMGEPGESWSAIAARARGIITGDYITPVKGAHWHVEQAKRWRDGS